MKRKPFLIYIVVVLTILCGGNTYIVIHETNKVDHHTFIVCQEHRLLAKLAREEAEESVQSNKVVLPHVNIPGLTHAELVKVTEEKTARQLDRAERLNRISKETC